MPYIWSRDTNTKLRHILAEVLQKKFRLEFITKKYQLFNTILIYTLLALLVFSPLSTINNYLNKNDAENSSLAYILINCFIALLYKIKDMVFDYPKKIMCNIQYLERYTSLQDNINYQLLMSTDKSISENDYLFWSITLLNFLKNTEPEVTSSMESSYDKHCKKNNIVNNSILEDLNIALRNIHVPNNSSPIYFNMPIQLSSLVKNKDMLQYDEEKEEYTISCATDQFKAKCRETTTFKMNENNTENNNRINQEVEIEMQTYQDNRLYIDEHKV